MDSSKVYKVRGFEGVACRFAGYPQRWEPYTYFAVDDETGEEYETESADGEWVDDTDSGMVLMVMVGDDHKHKVSENRCTPIDDLDYCASCGQIGCAHDGRDRSEVA